MEKNKKTSVKETTYDKINLLKRIKKLLTKLQTLNRIEDDMNKSDKGDEYEKLYKKALTLDNDEQNEKDKFMKNNKSIWQQKITDVKEGRKTLEEMIIEKTREYDKDKVDYNDKINITSKIGYSWVNRYDYDGIINYNKIYDRIINYSKTSGKNNNNIDIINNYIDNNINIKNYCIDNKISDINNKIKKIFGDNKDNCNKIFTYNEETCEFAKQEDTFSDKGIYYCNKGGRYEGDFKNGLREGKGIMYHKNGDIYEGDVKDNKAEGKGIFYYNNGDKYVGEWKNDKFEGKGIYYYSNGDRYKGEWKNDQFDTGEITFYDENNKKGFSQEHKIYVQYADNSKQYKLYTFKYNNKEIVIKINEKTGYRESVVYKHNGKIIEYNKNGDVYIDDSKQPLQNDSDKMKQLETIDDTINEFYDSLYMAHEEYYKNNNNNYELPGFQSPINFLKNALNNVYNYKTNDYDERVDISNISDIDTNLTEEEKEEEKANIKTASGKLVDVIEESINDLKNSQNNILEKQLLFDTSSYPHAVLLHLDKEKYKITIYNTGTNNEEIQKLLEYINNSNLKEKLATDIGWPVEKLNIKQKGYSIDDLMNIKQKDDKHYEQNGPTCVMASTEAARIKWHKRIMAKRLRNKIKDYESKKDKFEIVIKQLKRFMKQKHKYFTEEGLDKIANDIKKDKIEIDEKNEYKKFLEINEKYMKDIGINTLKQR